MITIIKHIILKSNNIYGQSQNYSSMAILAVSKIVITNRYACSPGVGRR